MPSEPQTLQARMGFQDPDLKTPQHDALMAWLTDNVQDHPRVKQWAEQIFDKWQKSAAYSATNGRMLVSAIDVLEKQWEKPLKATRGSMVGFIDLAVDVALRSVWLHDADLVKKNSGYYFGKEISRIDRKILFQDDWRISTLNIEVKPRIFSVGEVVRQINLYRSTLDHSRDDYFFVACPDVRFASIFEAQGFGFIQLPSLKTISSETAQQLMEASE